MEESDRNIRIKAKERAEKKVAFYIHLSVYILVNTFLIITWWFTSGPNTFPWFIFPLVGWGIAVVLHFLNVVYAGSRFVEKLTEKEYEKLKKREY